MKNIYNGASYYIFGVNEGNIIQKYSIDNVDKAVLDFLNNNSKKYMAFGIEYTGTQFQYGVASCDLFVKKDGVKRISQDYKKVFTDELLYHTEIIIKIINRVIKV